MRFSLKLATLFFVSISSKSKPYLDIKGVLREHVKRNISFTMNEVNNWLKSLQEWKSRVDHCKKVEENI